MKVKKEATVAVVIGLILALVVTGGVIRARKALQNIKLPTQVSFKKNSNEPVDTKTELFLEITTTDNSVVTEPKLAISGKTLPGTYIAILTEKSDYLIVPNEIGSFTQDVVLVKGANTITINVFQNDGKKIERKLNAVYTTAQL